MYSVLPYFFLIKSRQKSRRSDQSTLSCFFLEDRQGKISVPMWKYGKAQKLNASALAVFLSKKQFTQHYSALRHCLRTVTACGYKAQN